MSYLRPFARWSIALCLVLSGIAACGGAGGNTAATGAPDAPAAGVPPADPPAADPPATDPPATDPPATDPPATDPPAASPGTVAPASACASDGAAIGFQRQFLASNPDDGDRFAAALAMSADTIALAAEREASKAAGFDGNQLDNSIANAGAVYLWECENGAWRQTHYLKAPDGAKKNDYFGSSLALSGDTLIVGAKGRTVADKTHVGAAFVYRKAQDGWRHVATLTEPALGANALFGHGVAVSGDLAAVGAPYENGDAGKLFFYRRSGDSWTLEQAVAGTAGANLGRRVAMSGATLVTNSADAALVYARDASGDGLHAWSLQAALAGKRSYLGLEGRVTFGHDAAVAIAGDRIAVTNPATAAVSATNAGIACAFRRVAGAWAADGYCFTPDPASYALKDMFFGQSGVALLDNGRIVVTADADSSAGIGGHGSVFVFAKSGDAWVAEQNIRSPDGVKPLVNFGYAGVAAAGDSFIVSEQLYSGSKTRQGTAYLFGPR